MECYTQKNISPEITEKIQDTIEYIQENKEVLEIEIEKIEELKTIKETK